MYGYTPEALAKVATFNQDTRLIRVKSSLESEPFMVHRMHGTEEVSRPFAFTVELLSPDAQLELKQIVGQPMRLSLQAPDGDRHFHGYVKEFARIGTDGDLVRYQAQIGPWFGFLQHTSNCRIFQDLSVVEIVEEVFAPYAELAACKYDVDAGKYPKLPYCVQYNESDFAFVSRLLEEAGIYYHFAHAQDGHTLVLCDDSTQCPAIAGQNTVRYLPDIGVQDEHGLDQWATRRRVGTSVQALKSFDFKQPKSPLAVDRPLDIPNGVLPRLESYYYEGAASYRDSQIGDALAALRAEELAWPTKLFEGGGNIRSLQPGHHFVLHGHFEHLEPDEEARQFFVMQLAHDVRNNFSDGYTEVEGASYRCSTTALRRKIPFRPQRQTPQPRMPGPQTATVVGPPGEEIHADRYGRVKVQFHWDRLGQFNDASSCWVRVASPWAGSGMGGVSPPRIGQEVVVDFLDGHPDRPIITGRVFNEDNMPPFGLEVSGLKSKTVKGEGFNEVTMHDGVGKQLLNMHAQRDMATTVQNDQNTAVNNNKATTVANNHSMNVGVNQDIAVGANRGINVKGNDALTIVGARTTDVTGTAATTVTGAVTELFKNGQSLTIPAVGYTESITGPFLTSLTGDYTSQRIGAWKESVTGVSERAVSGAVTEIMGAGRTQSVTGDDKRQVSALVEDINGGDRTLSVGGKMEQGVATTLAISAGGDMTLGSGSLVAMGVGEASGISITAGEIVITSGGSTVVINAGGISVNGAKINLN
ncbi:type VI secretion system Vgr family protein [Lysobacter cavernae]|uniref:Type VI secretion system Vgr family protein n=1 Tax=Lysobacter cavernae TaxID=1685901 RepID=A0ABV7RUP4_9GAMM